MPGEEGRLCRSSGAGAQQSAIGTGAHMALGAHTGSRPAERVNVHRPHPHPRAITSDLDFRGLEDCVKKQAKEDE